MKSSANKPLGVGIIGCGNISATYLELIPLFRNIEVAGVADLDQSRADARAARYGVTAFDVDGILTSPDIDIILNLTVPTAHFEVSRSSLAAGKHVYTEKPLSLSLQDGQKLKTLAQEQQRLVCAAPDTFLGGAHQNVRFLLDTGELGQITSGTAFVLSAGMEDWHPDPGFFFAPGGGPVLDLGPYYLSALVDLVGPVRRLSALSSTPRAHRTIGSGPRKGERLKVSTPTTLHALLEFASGALITFGASWDVTAHTHNHIELYCENGAMILPDPNFFGGTVQCASVGLPFETLSGSFHSFSVSNQVHDGRERANYRAAGLADMARAIKTGTAPRCSLEFSLHVLDIMLTILKSAQTGKVENLTTTCQRPEPLTAEQAEMMLKG